MKKIIALAVLGLFTACAALNSPAADKPADKPAAPEKGDKKLDKAEKKAARPLPFHGKVTAVDKNTKVITVGERKFQATSTTKIVKAGKPAILTDANAGDAVGGAYREVDGGKLELVSLRIGPKPAEDKKEDKK